MSAVFKEYKDIYNSSVVVNGTELDIYRLTTEGLKLKSPQGLVSLIVSAEVRTDDGMTLSDSYSISVGTPGELPSAEELEKEVRGFADRLLRLKSAPLVEETYNGPVLFEGSAVSRIFRNNLLERGKLVAVRNLAPVTGTLEDQFGKQIIDKRLGVKNYTALEEYAGEPLWGHYGVDADGVVPAKEMTLVEGGVLKTLLNGRYPTLKAPATTGSSKFSLEPTNLTATPLFGTAHVTVEKGTAPEKMKKALLKAAKAAGLDYAYMVRRIAGAVSEVWRVSVKDGTETQVRVLKLEVPKQDKLMSLGAISSGERVYNFLQSDSPVSLICPEGMVVNGVELPRAVSKPEQTPAIPSPLQR